MNARMRSPWRYRSRGICSFSGRIASVRPRFTMMFFFSKRCTMPDSIASSSACTMMSRLMPFSLHTCSMTRFRSGNIGPSCPSGVRRPGRASEVVFDVGLLDGRERQLDAADRLVLDGDAVGRHGLERTVEHAPVADRVVRPHANALPE